MSSIDEDTKQEIVEAYLKGGPTAENSMTIVNELAERFDRSANSIRMLLSNAGVYIKKTASKPSTTTKSDSEDKATRKSKQSSIDELAEAIKNAGQEVDDAILSKLTGKAAEYLNNIIRSLSK